MTIKIYTTDGEKLFLENIDWSKMNTEYYNVGDCIVYFKVYV